MSCNQWKEYKLEDVIEIYNSKRVPLSSREREQKQGEYPYYGAQGVIDYIDEYIFDGEYLLIAEDGNNLRERKDDIARIAKGKFWVNNHAHIIKNNKLSNMKFIMYYLNLINIESYVTGSAQPKLNKANLCSIKVSLPPLEEQEKVVRIIDSLDKKIELNNEMNKTLEEMAQALFKRWFVDFEFPNDEGKPYKSSGGEMVESELGMIPKGWNIGTFRDYTERVLGGDWGKAEEQARYTKQVFCLRGADIPEIKKGSMGSMPERYILEKNYENKKLSEGDLVIEISGGSPTQSTGRITYINNTLLSKYNLSIVCTNFCRAISLKNKKCMYFFYMKWLGLYNSDVFFQYENGTTGIKNLDINSFLDKYNIVIPNEQIILKFNEVCKSIFNTIQENGNENNRIVELRDSLLPKLMSGEIRVEDIEANL